MMTKNIKTYVSPQIVVIRTESFRLLSNSNDEWTGDQLGREGDFDFEDEQDTESGTVTDMLTGEGRKNNIIRYRSVLH